MTTRKHPPSIEPTRGSAAPEPRRLDRVYDVFLSHRKADEVVVMDLVRHIEEDLHFEAYVDWKQDRELLDRSHVTPQTAAHLRNVMRHARSLVFVVGADASASSWTPWELGFFDGRQSARRIGVYLPDGVDLPRQLEYLGLYGEPLRKGDLKRFLEDAFLDVASMDSAQIDQWQRHLARLSSDPRDYLLSVLQWNYGVLANLLTTREVDPTSQVGQPEDIPREPAAVFGPMLEMLRSVQYATADLRRQLRGGHAPTVSAMPLDADLLKQMSDFWSKAMTAMRPEGAVAEIAGLPPGADWMTQIPDFWAQVIAAMRPGGQLIETAKSSSRSRPPVRRNP